MHTLILAAGSATPPGEDFWLPMWILLGVALVIAAIAAAIVTPRAEHH